MQYVLHVISSISGTLVSLLSVGGYWFLGIILILEALPVVGTFLPGHVVIIAAGFLAKLGILNLWLVLLVGTIATVVGDVIGFLAGRKYGYDALQKIAGIFFVREEHIEKTIDKTKTMIDAHTGKTIVFGKFSPITRPFIPYLVGASGVHIRTFWFYNLLGGALWITASVMVGYVFGASYHVVAQYFGKFILAAFIISALILWGFKFANARFHVFKKYELFVLGLNVISLWALAKTIQDSFSLYSFMSNFDIATNIFMAKNVTPVIAQTALVISELGGIVSMTILGLGIGIGYLVKKKWRRGIIMILSILSTSFIVTMMKELFMRVRPHDALMTLSDPSFPSGHASLVAAFFVAFAYVVIPHFKSWVKREAFIVGCVVFVALVGMSRVVLNVHWASDVIAGWSLGIFLATSSILLVRYVSGLFIKHS